MSKLGKLGRLCLQGLLGCQERQNRLGGLGQQVGLCLKDVHIMGSPERLPRID